MDLFLQQFAKGLTPKVQNQLITMKLSVSQWVTLGSLVEKEASKKSDRPLIASVLMNGIKIDQPLQIDVTIQFMLGIPKAKLYDKDLQIPSPYNTISIVGYRQGLLPILDMPHCRLHCIRTKRISCTMLRKKMDIMRLLRRMQNI